MKRLALVLCALSGACAADSAKAPPLPPTPAWAGPIIDELIAGPIHIGPDTTTDTPLQHVGATFLKPHFAYVLLLPGDRLALLGKNDRIVDRIEHSGRDLWALSGNGERLLVRLQTGPESGPRGFLIDRVGVGAVPVDGELISSVSQASVCGANDKLPVACLDDPASDLHDPAKANAARAVARLLFPSGIAMGLCTGSLISADGHLITNNHCVANQWTADGLEAKFNYQEATCAGGDDGEANVTTVKGVTLIKTSQPLDYSLLKLDPSFATQFGHLEVATADEQELAVGDPIYIVQHPNGKPKQVAAFDSQTQSSCTVREINVSAPTFAEHANIGYTCDTEGGSSGSPILSATTQRLLALHHLGGCNNNGTYLRDIWPEIAAEIAPPPP